MKRFNFTVIGNTLFLPILAATIMLVQHPAIADTEKIAILPFEIHSQTDLDYMGHGIHQMLTSRLAWKDRVVVVEPQVPFLPGTPMAQSAADLGADYVLSGSVTEFAGAFSVDATVFKAGPRSIETFFGQAATVEQIIPQLDILAARINHSLFDRKTAALEAITPAAPDAVTFNVRANPEKLMPPPVTPRGGGDRPFWKFWEKDSPDPHDSVESDESFETGPGEFPEGEKEDRPFWKFW